MRHTKSTVPYRPSNPPELRVPGTTWVWLLGLVALVSDARAESPPDYARHIGVTHWDSRYNFTNRPILEEGADRLWDAGVRVIKLELETSGKIPREYDFNHRWGRYDTIAELAASPEFTAVINRPWAWVNFQIFESQREVPVEWCDGMNANEIAAETRAFYELTRFLLTRYRDSGIRFLLDNWEGDNALDKNDCYPEGGGGVDWTARDGMVKWLSARQAGIVRARTEVGEHNVWVDGGAECNSTPDHEWPPGSGSQCGFNVLPFIDPPPDLCGLSAYRDEQSTDMGPAIAWMRDRCNTKRTDPRWGADTIYVAELGAAGNLVGDTRQFAITRAQIDSALAHGARLSIYWQLFSNECVAGCPNHPVRDMDVRGFWLIRPEPREHGGTPTPTWNWMTQVLAKNRTTASPPRGPEPRQLVARASGRCLVPTKAIVTVTACDPASRPWVLEEAPKGLAHLISGARAMLGQGVRPSLGKKPAAGVWRVTAVPEGGGYAFIQHAATQKCLELRDGTYADGAQLRLAPCRRTNDAAGYAQMFLLR